MSLSFQRSAIFLTYLLIVMASEATMFVEMQAGEEPDRDALVVRGTTGMSQTFKIADLKKLPRTEIETTDRKGQNVKYAGIAVSELLKKVGAAQGETLRGEWLRAFVAVDARDDYRAVFALTEFDPDFTDRLIIVAYERDGVSLTEQTGPLQIIVPGEKKHARWVRMVKQIRVLDSAWIKE